MGVNGPEPAFFWDDTTKSWRKPLAGEPGEYTWNPTTNSWEFGSVGAEYKWNSTTRSWDFGPGGQYVWNATTRSWDKNTDTGEGSYYWDETTRSWLKGAGGLAWAESDPYAWDFLTNQARFAGVNLGALSNTPGWSFARASSGYAQNAAGVLIPFASGEMRRTDKGVLIEGARTNLCLRSQEFDNASWTKHRASISTNIVTAPDGTLTADKLIEDGASGTHRVYQYVTKAASAIQYTASAYFKAAERTFAQIRVSEGGEVNPNGVAINLSDGTLSATYGSGFTGVSATSQSLGNGWYRLALTFTTATDTTVAMFLLPALGITASAPSYTGDDVSGVYVWGAQIEAAAFPSSYIPTTTASVTRAADALSITGVSGITYPMTMFAEIEARLSGTITGATFISICAGDGTTNNRNILHYYENIQAAMQTRAGGVTQADFGVVSGISAGQIIRSASRSATNSFQVARGGTLGAGDVSGSVPASPSVLEFGSNAGGSFLFGYLRRASIAARALSDAELQARTA